MTAYVLFVDDDVSNLIVWEAACAERFPVLTASNADEALQQLRTHEVAVILSDLRMPGCNGIQLLEQVRREFPGAIRMLITAHSELGVAVDAINRGGVRRFLQKPCSIQDLRAEMTEAMDLYELRIHARSVERRLMLTERIYTLGLAAGGLDRPLDRSACLIRESMNRARQQVYAIVANVDPGVGRAGALRRELDALEEGLTAALLQVERVMELTAGDATQVNVSGGEARVDVAAVLHLALSIARSDVRTSTELELELSEVPLARGESRKLSQVILSLLVNASEAVSSLPREQRAITVRLNTESDRVCLDVIDSGPPLDGEPSQVFDPLRPCGNSRRGGLGLAISKALVEEMGGELRVGSPDSRGTAFRVVLPAA